MSSVDTTPSSLQGSPTHLNEADRADLDKMLGNPLFFPDAFKDWLTDYLALSIPLIPYSQIFGAHQNTARSGSFVETDESNGTAGWKDLPTVGPRLQLLSDGTYLIAYGAAGRDAFSIAINGDTSTCDNDRCYAIELGPNMGRAKIATLKSTPPHNNEICMKYNSTTRSYSKRWLTAIRIGAPGE